MGSGSVMILFYICFIYPLTIFCQDNRIPFRTELFPEQLKQQQVQFRQQELNLRSSDIQRLIQISGGEQLQQLLQEQRRIQRELGELLDEQVRLQEDIQKRLRGQTPTERIINQGQFSQQSNQQFSQENQFQNQQQPQFPFQEQFQQPQFPQQGTQFPEQPEFQESQSFQQQEGPPFPQESSQFQQGQPQFPQQQPQFPQQQPQFPQQQPQFPQQQPQFPQQQPQFPQQQPQFPQQQPQFPQQQPQDPDDFQSPILPLEEDVVFTCQTAEGEEGLCRPLIKCLAFYADLPDLRKQPCALGKGEQGVCCPRRARPPPQGPRDSGILVSPPPKEVPLPPIAPQQIQEVTETALETIRQRFNFILSLFQQGIFVRPNTPTAWHLEFFPTSNETLQSGEEAQKNIEASTLLVNEFNLSPDQGTFGLPKFSILNTIIADTCPRESQCFSFAKYRSFDGSCNNLQHSDWGKAGTALQRILPPKYLDGVSKPRNQSADGRELPSARFVSTLFATEADRSHDNYTMMVMQWGQFIDHDLTHTPIARGAGGSGITCCQEGEEIPFNQRHPDCFPISIPRSDRVFSPFGERCMEFSRSLPAPRPQCNFGPREQMNQITGWLDGSNVYGSSEKTARQLREFRGGRLKAQVVGSRKRRALLPPNPSECTNDQNNLACFEAGDGRVNEQVDLALMHTLWMREHNRIASALRSLHPDWSDEAIYQEARRITVAELQHITYNEFLPIVLGQSYMDKSNMRPRDNGWTTLYDPELNPSITNVFATAAFRFGHSLIQSHLHGYGRFGNLRRNLRLSKQHFAPFDLYDEGAIDDLLRGLSAQASQKSDRFFSKELTDHLFQGDLDIGLDLVALNIQRGRDHGLPPYNDWREVCGLSKANDWQDLANIMGFESVNILQRLYPSVDEVDIFIGAIAEPPTEGSLLGPTFTCLIGDQFARLRRADRHFYEEANQPSTFSEEQLKQIRKTSLARIICDNADDVVLIQPLVFIQPSFLNQRVTCTSNAIPRVDLTAWASERPANA